MSNENAESLAKAFKIAEDLDELQMRREVEEMLTKLKLNMMFNWLLELYTFDSKTYYNLVELHTKLKELTDET